MLLKKKPPILFLALHFILLTLPALFLGMTFPLMYRMLGSVGASYWLLQSGLVFWCLGGVFSVVYFPKLNLLVPNKYRFLVAAWVQLIGFLTCSLAQNYFFFFLGMAFIGIGGSWFIYLSMLLLYWLNLKNVYLYLSYGILCITALSPFLSEGFVISGGWRFTFGAIFTLNFFTLVPYTYLKLELSDYILNEKPMRNAKILSSLKPLCSAIAIIFAFFLYWFSIASITMEAGLKASTVFSLVGQGLILVSFLLGSTVRFVHKSLVTERATLIAEFLYWFSLALALGYHLIFKVTINSFVTSLSLFAFFSGFLFTNLLTGLLMWPHIRFQRKVHLLLGRIFIWGAIFSFFAIMLPRAPLQVLSILLIMGGLQTLFYYNWVDRLCKMKGEQA
jgi:hypothetical protein